MAPVRPRVLREYALLADGERGVVVDPDGAYVWMCFPRWDDDAVFASLIGGRGSYAITPRGRFVWGGSYESGGLIWRSRWVTDDGIVQCREALVLPSQSRRAVLLRRVTALSGGACLDVRLDLRAGYGNDAVDELERGEDGAWRGRLGEARFGWTGAPRARVEIDRGGEVLIDSLDLEPGEHHDFVLALEAGGAPVVPTPDTAWRATEEGWRWRVPPVDHAIAERDARHACAVLAGLTSSGGGMVAAATTSLPERAEQGRNYDYRYVWIRDQCYAGNAAAKARAYSLMDDAVRFVCERLLEHGPELRPAYTTVGESLPDEHRLGLPGYPGGGDLVGNRVNEQFQLDAFGEALLLLASAAREDRLDGDGWRAVEIAAEAIGKRWREPDAGIWEIEARRWTHSGMICVAGLRAAAAHAPVRERAAGWRTLADEIGQEVANRAVHPSGRWQRAPDDKRLDAALLLLPIRGAVAADDPRSIATLRAVERELASDGYVYRFRPDDRPLGEAEGAFLLCGFFMALACAQRGDDVAAARWFERNRSASGPPGLLSEEFDVRQRQLRGNLPQAFVHALLLECAVELYR